jgi:hypothetical protein
LSVPVADGSRGLAASGELGGFESACWYDSINTKDVRSSWRSSLAIRQLRRRAMSTKPTKADDALLIMQIVQVTGRLGLSMAGAMSLR